MVPIIVKMVEEAFDATKDMNGPGPDPATLNRMMRNTIKRRVVGKIFKNTGLPSNITRFELAPFIGAGTGSARRSTRRRKNKKLSSRKRKQTRRHA